MYVIQMETRYANGETILSYFKGFGFMGTYEFCNIKNAHRFGTKKEAQIFIKEKMSHNKIRKYKVITIN